MPTDIPIDPATGQPLDFSGYGDDWPGIGSVQDPDGSWRPGTIAELGSVWDFGPAEGDADAAALMQEQFEMNRAQYNPIAQSIAGRLTDPGEFDANVDQARQYGLGAGTSAMGSANRDIRRYGASMTPSQRQQMQTGLAMDRTAGGIGAANNARESNMYTNLAGLDQFHKIGAGVESAGIGGIMDASSRNADRLAQNQVMEDQASAQTSANKMGLATTALSIWASTGFAGL